MTTIVYRDGVLASDTRETFEDPDCGTRYRDDCEKVFELVGGGYIAGSGDSAGLDLWLDCFNNPNNEDRRWNLLEYQSHYVLWWDKSGLWVSDETLVLHDISGVEFYAIGSGAKVAMGALHMGADAETAVRIASQVDPYTSNIVRSYRL
ncbi:MAG: hypothetical protein AAFX44_06720 [Pseudomonadota bacterium]